MASDFLKKLAESVETGKPNDAVKAVYNEILDKADKYAANPDTMKELQEKANDISEKAAVEVAKKLTAEEVMQLNAIAKQEEERMLVNEQKAKVTSAVIMLNCEIEELEALIVDYKERISILQGDLDYAEKNKLIERTIREIND